MTERQGTTKNQDKRVNDGFLMEIYQNVRLILRLMKDSRVNILLKLLPVGALIYLLTPVDFIPLNPVDDGLVLWLGGYLFIELCPDEVVEEHRKTLRGEPGQKPADSQPDVVEGTYRDIA